jgi:hypothetical protein
LVVKDLQGKTLLSEVMNQNLQDQQFVMDVSGFLPGTYVVMLASGAYSASAKMVVK